MTPRFVGIVPRAVEDLSLRHHLTFSDRSVLLHLLMYADDKTGEVRCTLAELGQRLGMYRKNVRPKLDRLVEEGLIECRFPKGHEGAVKVLCYGQIVHGGRLTADRRNGSAGGPQGANRPIRKGQSRPLRGGTDPIAVRGESPHAEGQIAPCDQEPPVWSETSALLDFHEAGDTVSPLLRKPDAPHSRDEVA